MPRTKQLRYNQFKNDSYCWIFDNLKNELREETNLLINQTINQYKSVTIELCAGYCEYSLEYAKDNQDTLYIAIDIKQDRLMSGCLVAKSLDLTNIRFLSSDIANLDSIFEANVDNILLIHPDPQPKNQKQRLNQTKYLDIYYKLLKRESTISLITDNQDFYEEFSQNYNKELWQLVNHKIEVIRTRYNKKFINEENSSKIITLKKKKVIL